MALRAGNMTASRKKDATDAFDRLFVEEYRRVVAIAYRVLNDPIEAEDVAQEVFVSFHRRHKADAAFAPAWLHRAASHLALNALRTRKRRDRREMEDAIATARVQVAPAGYLDPAETVQLSEERQTVREALGRMPKRSAAVLALRYSGLSYAEVASALGCGIGQIGTLLRRAEETLRKELDHETR